MSQHRPEVTFSDLPGSTAPARILTPEATDFITRLEERFGARRAALIEERATRSAPADLLDETREIRESDWAVAPPRDDYADRRIEITGPTDRKLIINALNSGAKGFMADFEDANSPTWRNQVEGQENLLDAVDGTISYTSSDGKSYALGESPATLLVRPRGWHMVEDNFRLNDVPVSAGLFDFGLYAFHCARLLADSGRGVYFYLPKMEHHLEARLWNDVFAFTEDELGLATGSIRATVLIETLPAAFQMTEILWELRDHSYGLNAGRWDYIFSTIKSYRNDPDFVLPDRSAVTMAVPFMKSYANLLVKTCHERGAFAMGGMSALVPSRSDEGVNSRAIEAVRSDKRREAEAGFDGTWVAHPDLVTDAVREFDTVIGDRPNQIEKQRPDVEFSSGDLLAVSDTPGEITETGLRGNINIAFRYISFWLSGRGAVNIDGMMEDAATAEISRSQVWQWMRHEQKLDDGRLIDHELVRGLLVEEMEKIQSGVSAEVWQEGRPQETRSVFEAVSLGGELPEFLTLVAYGYLNGSD